MTLWQVSTPEAQGVSSQNLAEMLAYVQQENINLHSLLIVRNNTLITEAYFYPYQADSLHDTRSVAKSVMSILVGIAIDKGYLKSANQPVLEFFPQRQFANVDERKKNITLAHLLSMSSGLRWSDADVHQMMQSPDWLHFVLDGEMVADPGTQFVYSTPNTYLLSAILTAATGMTALEFARLFLFDPLRIGEVRWQTGPRGINMGGMGLWMTSRDMARLGQLYLQYGIWEGQQIISPEWVKISTTPPEGNYAYLWWADPIAKLYFASGYGGQMIYVLPEKNMVVVYTAGLANANEVTRALLDQFTQPATESFEALPEKRATLQALEAHIQAIASPQPRPVPSLPETIQQISGQSYALAENPFGWTSFRFNFQENSATMEVVMNEDRAILPIGLDGVVQFQPVEKLTPFSDHDPLGMTGYPKNENTFWLRFEILNNPEWWTIRFEFEGEQVRITMTDMITLHTENLHGAKKSEDNDKGFQPLA